MCVLGYIFLVSFSYSLIYYIIIISLAAFLAFCFVYTADPIHIISSSVQLSVLVRLSPHIPT